MKLAGAVTQGNGPINEDGLGFLGTIDDIEAAWIFDGVTGINDGKFLPADSDAQWLVQRAHHHLLSLAADDLPLPDLLSRLVGHLISDWDATAQKLSLPASYDPPAACLILAKRYGTDWKALRLGDSCLLARYSDQRHRIHAASPNNVLDHWLTREAQKRRDAGFLDVKALLQEFRPLLMAGRQKRNQPGGYSILECNTASLAMPEFVDLGTPEQILLCTDGFYRAVDHYQMHDDASLIAASQRSVEDVLRGIRERETEDPECIRYPRFKPADDATAVMLVR
jgi:hypothetical protein